MAQQTKFFPTRGGLDLVTPAIEKSPGTAISTDNYEAHPRGYQRIEGYERFDGQQKPSTASYWVLDFDAGVAAINEGDTVTGATSSATGVALIDAVIESGSYVGSDADGYNVLTNVSGTFQNNENLQVSAVTKSVMDGTAVERGADNDTDDDTWLQDAMETARGNIAAVTGSGDMRGVWPLNGVAYAFRDNVGATAVDIYKSTTSGWSLVALGRFLPFTSGGTTEILEGQVIEGLISGATATLTRVALQSGSWAAGTAVGYFIFASQTGTFQAEGVEVSGSGDLATIAADSTAITLAAGGRFQFANHNFGGHAGDVRMYGCDGASKAFEFDGTVFVPILTGMTTDTPSHLEIHKSHLFLSFTGGSVQNSGLGLPYQFTVITGAAEMAIGEEVTGMRSDVEGFLVIGGRNKISILYGQDSSNWELVTWSDESGIIENSMEKLGSIMFVDDIGLRRLSTARDYGNFKLASLSSRIEPLFRSKRKAGITITASLRTRSKDMYRLFFSDGTALSAYLGRGINKPEWMQFTLPIVVKCASSGEDSSGNEILFFGSTDGFIYELDAGNNHDSAEVSAHIRFPFNHVGSPTREKQWFKATLEVDASNSASLGVLAEFTYAEDIQIPSIENSFTITGGGGFWEEANWDEFDWSSPVEGLAQSPIDGIGENISVAVVSSGTYDDPHRIHGLTLHYSMRRLIR